MGAVEKTPKHHIPVPTDGPLRMRDPRAFPRKDWQDFAKDGGAAPKNTYTDDERLRGMPKRGGA